MFTIPEQHQQKIAESLSISFILYMNID